MKKTLALLAWATALAIAPHTLAEQYGFSFSGDGIYTSGVITATPTSTPDLGFEITGITGHFTDTNSGVSGAITGLESPSYVVGPPPAISEGGFSYDDLYYPLDNAAEVCPGYFFGGGTIDIYGVLFDVAGGYQADVWSDGLGTTPTLPGITYGAADSIGTTMLDYQYQGISATPEPSSFLLLGSGLFGMAGGLYRKLRASR